MSTKLYTMGDMLDGVVHVAGCTAFESDHQSVYANDFNIDRYAEWSSSSGTQTLSIDFGSGNTVDPDYCCLFVNNYLTSIGGTFTVERSSNGSSWTSAASTGNWTDTSTPIRILQITGSGAYRYWRISASSLSAVPYIGLLAFAKLSEIDQGSEYPANNTRRFYTRKSQAAGARPFVHLLNRNKVMDFNRTFKFITGTTDIETLRSAFDDSKGSTCPLIFHETTDIDDAIVVRFATDQFAEIVQGYQFHQVTLPFRQQPFIADGNVY